MDSRADLQILPEVGQLLLEAGLLLLDLLHLPGGHLHLEAEGVQLLALILEQTVQHRVGLLQQILKGK